MLRRTLWEWAVLALFLLHASLVFALQEKVSRPAVKADLVGMWDMVLVQPVRDKNDPIFFPYQKFVFYNNASMKFMSSDKPFSNEWLEKFNKQNAEIDYLLDAKGVLTMSWQKTPHSEKVLCAYVLEDVPVEVASKLPLERRKGLPKRGSITLSFLNNSGRIAYQKVLSKTA